MEYFVTHFFLPFFLCAGALALLPLTEQAVLQKLFLAFLTSVWLSGLVSADALLMESWWQEIPILFVCGVLLSLPVVMFLAAISLWGELFDFSRGQHIAGVLDPLHHAQESTTAVLLKQAAWVSILYAGFGEVLLRGLARTVNMLPLMQSLTSAKLSEKALILWHSITDLFNQALLMFLPLAALFLLIELCAGFLGKLLPQLGLLTENFSIKLLLSSLALYYLCEGQVLEHYSRAVVDTIVQHSL